MSRENLKNNMLSEEIIRIDFMKLEKLDDNVNKLIPYMKQEGYQLNINTTYDINFEINDQDSLITQDIITKKTATQKINYVFKKDDINYTINEYMLIFEKTKFDNYKGLNEYLKLLLYILKQIVEGETITYQRVGIRKTNSILLKKESIINKIFTNFNNSQIDENSQVNINNKKTVISEQRCYNLLTSISNGIATINEEDMEAYQIILDIDFYTRNFEQQKSEYIINIINLLNQELYCVFESELTKSMIEILEKEEIEKEIQELGIIGGINRCQKL